MTVKLLFLVTILFAAPAPSFSQASEGEVVDNFFAAYDLRAIASVAPEQSPADWLLPYFRPHSYLRSEADSDHGKTPMVDQLYSTIGLVLADQFESKGRSIELRADGSIMVGGPAALHAELRELLTLLESVLDARVELSIDFFRLPAEDAPALPASSELTDRQVQALLKQYSSTPLHTHVLLQMRADRKMVVDLTHERSVITDYEPEIAQAAVAYHPVIETASFGTRLSLKATPTKSGLGLAINLLRGELIGDISDSNLGMRRELNGDDGLHSFFTPATIQGFELLNRSIAINTLLRDERALLLSSRFQTRTGSAQDLVLIRKRAGSLPLLLRRNFGQEGKQILIINSESLLPPQLESSGELLTSARFATDMRVFWDGRVRSLLETQFKGFDTKRPLSRLAASLGTIPFQHYGPWSLICSPSTANTSKGNQLSPDEALASCAQTFNSLLVDSELVEVSLVLEAVGQADKEIARAHLPLRIGTCSSFVLGVESLAITDYYIDVAQKASGANPLTASIFDGLALSITPRRTPSGQISLEIQGGAHLESNQSQTELGTGLLVDRIDQRAYDQLLLNQEVTFSAGDDSATVTLGSAEGSNTGLSLKISVQD